MIFHDIVFYSFVTVVGIQAIYYLFIFSRFAFLKSQDAITNKTQPPVSVIICAKNEAENLTAFLPHICNQNYPVFEIVLINDASSDDTLEVMEQFAAKHDTIKIVDVKAVETFWGNKKYALTLGIKASRYDTLVFTDADCKPVSTSWIAQMVAPISEHKTIVLGYGAYNTIKKSVLNRFIRFETLTTAITYFSFAKIGLPYMGVGRNLAYTKALFFKMNGFVDHMKIRSGDDDLFVNQAATKANTALALSKSSFTTSVPKTSFKAWYTQKRRHVSTAQYYKFKHKALLALLYITNLLFFALAIPLISWLYMPYYVIALIVFRIALQYIIYIKASQKLEEKGLILALPFLEFFLIVFQLVIFITNKISKPNYWK